MNCAEFKNTTRELQSLKELQGDKAAAEHLAGCPDCRKFLRYEEKLRQSFGMIAQEPFPASLAVKIMAIQTENLPEAEKSIPIYDRLRHYFSVFPFKVAMASAIIGFFAAFIILHSTTLKPDMAPSTDQTQLSLLKQQSLPTQQSLRAPKTTESADTTVVKSEISFEKGHIPGAMSFTLEESPQSEQLAPVTPKQFLTPQPELAMSGNKARAMSPQVESLMDFSTSAASEKCESESSADLSEHSVIPKESDKADIRGQEILDLLTRHSVELPEGQINIEELAMKGYISSQKLKELRPPSGCRWFLCIKNGQKTVQLKKD